MRLSKQSDEILNCNQKIVLLESEKKVQGEMLLSVKQEYQQLQNNTLVLEREKQELQDQIQNWKQTATQSQSRMDEIEQKFSLKLQEQAQTSNDQAKESLDKLSMLEEYKSNVSILEKERDVLMLELQKLKQSLETLEMFREKACEFERLLQSKEEENQYLISQLADNNNTADTEMEETKRQYEQMIDDAKTSFQIQLKTHKQTISQLEQTLKTIQQDHEKQVDQSTTNL